MQDSIKPLFHICWGIVLRFEANSQLIPRRHRNSTMAFDSDGSAENLHPNHSDYDSLFGDDSRYQAYSGLQPILSDFEHIPVDAARDLSSPQHAKEQLSEARLSVSTDAIFGARPDDEDGTDANKQPSDHPREACVSSSSSIVADPLSNPEGYQETTMSDRPSSPRENPQPLDTHGVGLESTPLPQQTQQDSSPESLNAEEAIPSELNDSRSAASGVDFNKFKLRRRNAQGKPTSEQMEALREAFIRKRLEQDGAEALTAKNSEEIPKDVRGFPSLGPKAGMSAEVIDNDRDAAAVYEYAWSRARQLQLTIQVDSRRKQPNTKQSRKTRRTRF